MSGGEAGRRQQLAAGVVMRKPRRDRTILDPHDIVVGERRRLDESALAPLMESMRAIGQQTPIAVRRVASDQYALVAGLHRLQACLRLGVWVSAEVFEDEREARLWEVSENLHRAELTVAERAAHVAEWIGLTEGKLGQLALVSGGRGNTGGVRAAARELGIEHCEVRRAVIIDAITPEAKVAARYAALDDNQSALLRVAHAEDQMAEVAEIVAARAASPLPDRDLPRRVAALEYRVAVLETVLEALLAAVSAP